MLRMDIDQSCTQTAQHIEPYRRIVYKCTGFTGCIQFAAQDTMPGIVFEVVGNKKWFQLIERDIEGGFNNTPVGLFLDTFSVGPLT